MTQVPSGGPGVPGAAAAKPRTSGLAIASLICGIGSLCTAGLSGIVGLVLGLVALSRISRSGGKVGGRGLAIAGTIVSACGILFLVLAVVASVVAMLVLRQRSETFSYVQSRIEERIIPPELREEVARDEINNIGVALHTYKTDIGHYPTQEEGGLEALVKRPKFRDAALAANWQGPYIDANTPDPWGHPYVYRCPGVHNRDGFDLYSFGPDGREGGGDDITNWGHPPEVIEEIEIPRELLEDLSLAP